MGRYAIAWPGDDVKSILAFEQDAVFLDNQGWWVYSNETKKRVLTELSFDVGNIPINISVPDIRSRLNSWSPVWTRWLGLAEDYELLRAQSVLTILKIMCGVRALDINFVLMHTGVPHHWDSSVISIACELIKVNQVFLYAVPFDDWRLLPIIQLGDIKSRHIFSCDLLESDLAKDVDLLVNSKLNNKSVTISTPANWKASYLFAIILNIYYSISFLKIFLILFKLGLGKNIAGGASKEWSVTNDYNFRGFLNIINRQRRFLISYNKNKISNAQVDIFTKSSIPRLILAAHNQPEANSYPEGGDHFNHVDIALSLRLKGYAGDLLYKEHPAVWHYSDVVIGLTRVGLYRSDEYINNLLELGCFLLPKNVPLSIKQNECGWYIPVTITGTIAIERSLAGLHTIVCGEPWFKGLPGTIRFSEINSLETIDSSWAVPDYKLATDAREFLVELLRNKALVNYPGIGTGRLGNDAKHRQLFSNQFRKLIELLRK